MAVYHRRVLEACVELQMVLGPEQLIFVLFGRRVLQLYVKVSCPQVVGRLLNWFETRLQNGAILEKLSYLWEKRICIFFPPSISFRKCINGIFSENMRVKERQCHMYRTAYRLPFFHVIIFFSSSPWIEYKVQYNFLADRVTVVGILSVFFLLG